MKNWRRWIWPFIGVLCSVGGIAFYLLRYHRDMSWYETLRLPEAKTSPAGALRVTWLGVSTLLIDDGDTAFLTDGFFSRPGLLKMTHVAPDESIIDATLARLHVHELAAVIALHSHYDHALDSPIVAQKTSALLVGSTSTANIGRGYGLPRERIRVVRDGEVLRFGRFKVTFILSVHSPNDRYPGTIDDELSAPASASAYRTGDCYSLLIEHAGHSILVHASAGFVPGKLAARRAEVVYLGVGNLGKQSHAYRETYWREVVQAVGAHRVIAIHWDDFFVPLSDTLPPLPPLMDDLDETMRDLTVFSKRDQVDLRLPREWSPADPFTPL
ncbi:MAG: fold metallo-hydrolase [Myxococcaceae bacterium]|nr:fold metallo-hydrolase [Myxococcaceae bacterium]